LPKSHMVNNPEGKQRERTRHVMEIDQVDHGEIWLFLERYQTNFGAKESFTLKLGACVDTVFWTKQVKRDKVKQPMKSRVQSVDWRKNGVVNEIHWLSEAFNPDSGPTGQSNRPMANQRIDRWAWRRQYSKKYTRWKVRRRRVSPLLANGSRVSF
jgi:hypothetical protein